MILEAVYILEHFLFAEPQIINFGGEYLYDFFYDKKNNRIDIKRSENKKHITDFFGDQISLVSAIVGENGSGKTSLMSILNKHDHFSKAVFVYNDNSSTPIIENRSGKRDENGNITSEEQVELLFNGTLLIDTVRIDIPPIYYSSIPDLELTDFYSPLKNTPISGKTFNDYYFDSIERNVMYLGSDLNKKLKEEHEEIPQYDKLFISAKPLSKRELRNTYGGFGREEGEVEIAQKITLDELWDCYEFDDKSKSHLTNDGRNLLKDVEVNIFSYLLIDATSIKTIFNGNYGLSVKEMMSSEEFDLKLSELLSSKIAFIDKYIYQRVFKEIKRLDYDGILSKVTEENFNKEINQKERNTNDVISSIKSMNLGGDIIKTVQEKFIKLFETDLDGDEFELLRKNVNEILKTISLPLSGTVDYHRKRFKDLMIEIEKGVEITFNSLREARLRILKQVLGKVFQSVKLFSAISDFIDYLKKLNDQLEGDSDKGVIVLNINSKDYELFDNLISVYRNMISCFNENSVINSQILQFNPSKRLSFGEKALLNLFSTFYDFTLNKHDHLRLKKNYLILLDEADLGFHPQWKQNYVYYITEVLPEIFSELFVREETQSMEEAEKINLSPNIQIIFATHDPFALSDIPNQNVTYLKKITNRTSEILDNFNSDIRPNKSFGANISELLSHSFYIRDGLIGDFSRNKINEVIDWLHDKENKSNAEYYKNVIDIIDEPVVFKKLIELYAEKMETEDLKELMKEEYLRIASQYRDKFGEDI